MNHYTNRQIATDWYLWITYVDPGKETTLEEFESMPVEEKIALQEKLWPEDILPIGDCDCPNCREARGGWSFEEAK